MNHLLQTLILRLNLVKPPRYARKFHGPVLVLGSAPTANLPANFDDSFSIITVNGAQYHLQQWGLREPDVTLLTCSQIEDKSPKTDSVRRVLAGHRTGSLYLIRWRHSRQKLVAALQAMAYGYDELHTFGRPARIALYSKVMGTENLEKDSDDRYSNGITAVLFALYHGATDVIISGIDPYSSGHAHGTADRARWHVEIDKQIIDALQRQGKRIFTADPGVADKTGLPLWGGAKA
jgi:hypothetical protein